MCLGVHGCPDHIHPLMFYFILLHQEDRRPDPWPVSRKLCYLSSFVGNLHTKSHFHGDIRWNKTLVNTLGKNSQGRITKVNLPSLVDTPTTTASLERLRRECFVNSHRLKGSPDVPSSIPSPHCHFLKIAKDRHTCIQT